MNARRGFPVIEVLAALAVIAIALLPLLRLQQSLADAAIAIERANDIDQVRRSAIAYIGALNIDDQTEGETEIGEWVVSWTATPIAGPEPADGIGGESRFDITLYAVDVRISGRDADTTFQIRQVGWTKTGRDPIEQF